MSELEELQKQKDAIDVRIQTILKAERDEALKTTRAAILMYKFTDQELRGDSPQKRAPKVKKPVTFRDPANDKEWDGAINQKGRKPDWINKAVANKTIEQFKVSADGIQPATSQLGDILAAGNDLAVRLPPPT